MEDQVAIGLWPRGRYLSSWRVHVLLPTFRFLSPESCPPTTEEPTFSLPLCLRCSSEGRVTYQGLWPWLCHLLLKASGLCPSRKPNLGRCSGCGSSGHTGDQATVHVGRSKGNLWESVLPFYHVGPEDLTQDFRISGKCLYMLNRITGLHL